MSKHTAGRHKKAAVPKRRPRAVKGASRRNLALGQNPARIEAPLTDATAPIGVIEVFGVDPDAVEVVEVVVDSGDLNRSSYRVYEARRR